MIASFQNIQVLTEKEKYNTVQWSLFSRRLCSDEKKRMVISEPDLNVWTLIMVQFGMVP